MPHAASVQGRRCKPWSNLLQRGRACCAIVLSRWSADHVGQAQDSEDDQRSVNDHGQYREQYVDVADEVFKCSVTEFADTDAAILAVEVCGHFVYP